MDTKDSKTKTQDQNPNPNPNQDQDQYRTNPREDLKESITCPITRELFYEPVVAEDGHTYEKNALESWFETQNTSPMSRIVISKNVYLNRFAKNVVSILCQKYPEWKEEVYRPPLKSYDEYKHEVHDHIFRKQYIKCLQYTKFDMGELITNKCINILLKDNHHTRTKNVLRHMINHSESLESTNPRSWRLIHVVCKYGCLDILKFLISKQVTLECETNRGWRPIHIACNHGHWYIVSLLVKHGVKVDAQTIDGFTPVHIACLTGAYDIIKYLTEACGANLEIPSKQGARPFHTLCYTDRLDIIHFLVRHNAKTNVRNGSGWRPIHIVCANATLRVVSYLVNKTKIHVNVPNKQGYYPIHIASSFGRLDVVRFLLETKRQDKEQPTQHPDFLRPLHIACQRGHDQIVKYLLDQKADMEAKTLKGLRPLHFAIKRKHVDVCKRLVKKGVQMHPIESSGWCPVDFACQEKHVDLLRMFLPHTDKKILHHTLHLSCQFGTVDMVSILVEEGDADPEYPLPNDMRRPLHTAIRKNPRPLPIVEYLVTDDQVGVRIDLVDMKGWTALHYACAKDKRDCISFLYEYGANIEKPVLGRPPKRPVHLVCEYASRECIQWFFTLGVNTTDDPKSGLCVVKCILKNTKLDESDKTYLLNKLCDCIPKETKRMQRK